MYIFEIAFSFYDDSYLMSIIEEFIFISLKLLTFNILKIELLIFFSDHLINYSPPL